MPGTKLGFGMDDVVIGDCRLDETGAADQHVVRPVDVCKLLDGREEMQTADGDLRTSCSCSTQGLQGQGNVQL